MIGATAQSESVGADTGSIVKLHITGKDGRVAIKARMVAVGADDVEVLNHHLAAVAEGQRYDVYAVLADACIVVYVRVDSVSVAHAQCARAAYLDALLTHGPQHGHVYKVGVCPRYVGDDHVVAV